MNARLTGEPDAGKLHVRFDEGEQRDWVTPARCSLLYCADKCIATSFG